MDIEAFVIQFHDHLAPTLDTYEQAIYLYVFRHSRLLGQDEVVLGFKSARRRMALGIGKAGTPMAEGLVRKKLASLQSKGCIQIIGTERTGTRVRLITPAEMPGLMPSRRVTGSSDIEEIDFFSEPAGRKAILFREADRCFYCRRQLSEQNYVIEHVVSRPTGNGSYRNVVAACRRCNDRKGAVKAADFLRQLYREGLLNDAELTDRLQSFGFGLANCAQCCNRPKGKVRPKALRYNRLDRSPDFHAVALSQVIGQFSDFCKRSVASIGHLSTGFKTNQSAED